MTETAHGIVTRQAMAPLVIEPIQVDDPGPGEILVRVMANGLCHTDYHAYHGPSDRYPVVLGHETAGVIESVGAGVPADRVGQRVILAWRAPCGSCRFCIQNRPAFCINSKAAGPRLHSADGLSLNRNLGIGGLISFTVVSAAQALPFPDDMPFTSACLIGCGVMTGLGAALYTAKIQPGSTVAVIGCGGVGVSAIQGARLAHAKRIIAVDVDERKLANATQFGATDLVHSREGSPSEQIRALTGGLGVDFALEAVGLPETIQQAVAACDRGGVAVVIGVPRPASTMTFPMDRFFRDRVQLRVSLYGDCLPTRDFPRLIQWYRSGALKLDELVSATIPLDQVADGFQAMLQGDVLRSVVVF